MKSRNSLALLLILGTAGTACDSLPEEEAEPGAGAIDPSAIPATPDLETSEQGLSVGGIGSKAVKRTGGGSPVASNWPKVAHTLYEFAFAGRPVTLPEREKICRETGGIGVFSVDVTSCRDGYQFVMPGRMDPQVQRCTEGTGRRYSPSQCVYRDHLGQYFFDDGPSVPPGAERFLPGRFLTGGDSRYAVLFWSAGQEHDYCYHHTHTYPNRFKKRCDDDFLVNMNRICNQAHEGVMGLSFNRLSCKAAAQAMYNAVDLGGNEAYANMKTIVYFAGKPAPYVPVGGSDNGECDVVCGEGTHREPPPACGCEPD